jgi:hypothetical protein
MKQVVHTLSNQTEIDLQNLVPPGVVKEPRQRTGGYPGLTLGTSSSESTKCNPAESYSTQTNMNSYALSTIEVSPRWCNWLSAYKLVHYLQHKLTWTSMRWATLRCHRGDAIDFQLASLFVICRGISRSNWAFTLLSANKILLIQGPGTTVCEGRVLNCRCTGIVVRFFFAEEFFKACCRGTL